MKSLLRNYSEYKKILSKPSQKINFADQSVFCLMLGFLLNKITDFNLLRQTLETAYELLAKDRLPQTDLFQWLLFLDENPHRIEDGIDFLKNIANDNSIDVYDEIQTLFNSNKYQKKALSSQNRYNSIDTVVMDNDNPEMSSDNFDGQKKQYVEYDMDQIKKMQEDQQMARKLQQEEDQIMQTGRMKLQETMCQICYVDLYQGIPSFLDKCGHGFHQQCLIQSFKVQISTNNFPLKCPDAQCSKQCLESDIKTILPEDAYKKYQDHTLKAYADLHGDSVSWCPTADCGYMFFYEKGDEPRFQCLQCKKQYCLNCRCQWHKDMSCAEYKVSTTISEDDKKFLDFVKGKKFKQCPKCKFWVEKNTGCDHMTCKCKFEFCYKCGGVYMKCECAQKMKEQNERRIALRQEANRKKKQKAQKKAAQMKEKGQQEPVRRGRSKKQSKK